ncbi:MAG: PKD domain-containing protein [Thermoplasmata archaeon]
MVAPSANAASALSNVYPLVGKSPIVASIPVGVNPDSAVFDSVNGYVYVVTHSTDNVSVINGTSVETAIALPGSNILLGAAFDSENGYVYVTNGFGNVSVINGTSVVASIPDNYAPDAAAFDSANGLVYVANYGSGTSGNVSVINGTQVVETIPVGAGPSGAAFDSANGYVYVTDYGVGFLGNVSVIDGTRVVATIPVGAAPFGVAFDSANGCVYVTNYNSYNVSVISGTHVVATVPVGEGPSAAAFDSANGYIYVTNEGNSNNVSVINGTSVVASIPVGFYPDAAAFDSANEYVYVANSFSDNVSVINGSFYFPSISAFTATPSAVEIGSTTIPATTFIVSARSGEGVLTFSYTGLPDGCSTSNVSTLACTPTQAGVYVVHVYVNNSAGYSATATTSLTVISAMSATATASPNPADAGSPVNFTSNPSGGSGVNTFEWEFGDGSLSSAQEPSHSYAASGTYIARVWVNDTDGGSITNTISITVDPPLKVVLGVSNATPALGQSIAINASASGGASPYSYAYAGLPPGCVSVNSPTIGCLPTQAGFYNFSVVVTDHNGVSTQATIPLEVVFDFTVAAPSVDTVGHAFTVSVKPEGGYGTLTYSYSGLPPGCSSADSPELTCTPTHVGNYNISISVHDQAGNHATNQVRVDVIAGGASSAWSFLESPPVLGGVIAAALAVALVGAVLYSGYRGRRGSGPEPYAVYQLPQPVGSHAEPSEPGPPSEGSAGTTPRDSDSATTEEDSLSDLI